MWYFCSVFFALVVSTYGLESWQVAFVAPDKGGKNSIQIGKLAPNGDLKNIRLLHTQEIPLGAINYDCKEKQVYYYTTSAEIRRALINDTHDESYAKDMCKSNFTTVASLDWKARQFWCVSYRLPSKWIFRRSSLADGATFEVVMEQLLWQPTTISNLTAHSNTGSLYYISRNREDATIYYRDSNGHVPNLAYVEQYSKDLVVNYKTYEVCWSESETPDVFTIKCADPSGMNVRSYTQRGDSAGKYQLRDISGNTILLYNDRDNSLYLADFLHDAPLRRIFSSQKNVSSAMFLPPSCHAYTDGIGHLI